MHSLVFALIFFLAVQHMDVAGAQKIKHIVVLMEENRSFDHMFGYYPGVNGLKGDEFNLVNSTNPSSLHVVVNGQQPQKALCDPDHSTPGTSVKIYGSVAAGKNDFTNPTMTGFVEQENHRGNAKTNYCNVMSMMNPQTVPVITALASEFALMQRFFCDHPGPTWPNRLFMLSATAAGCTETGTFYHNKDANLYPQSTFFDQLAKENLTWRNYYNDTPWELFLSSIARNPLNIAKMDQFYSDARNGKLPNFAWINPRAGANSTTKEGSNDQHPDHDVSLGERYYKDIYEALRASPQWNETLFIITYDEHGGYYDHVAPPINVPPPGDGEASYPDKNFLFDRLGVRIPTVLISPWIPKGLLISSPPAQQKPFQNSEYALTSIMATARKLFNMKTGPLTKRDAWAATFEHIFTLSSPRTDCPWNLPNAAPSYQDFSIEEELALPINDLQRDIMQMHANLVGVKYPSHITRQADFGPWVEEHYQLHVERTTKGNKMF